MPDDDATASRSDAPERAPAPTGPPDPLAGLRLEPPTWTERVERLLGGATVPTARLAVVGAALVAALVVAGAVGWWLLARRQPPPIEETLPTARAVTAPVATAAPPTTAPGVIAHAAGAVVAPGVYELPAGARVADLVEAAGGLSPDADGHRLNLAGPVGDGSRVYVPRVGEVVPPELAAGIEPSGPPGGDGGSSPGSGAGGGGGPAELVDLNEADVAELDTLPGVGPATAQAIVDHRTQHGPFTSVDDLIDVRGIGEAKLAQLRDLVTV